MTLATLILVVLAWTSPAAGTSFDPTAVAGTTAKACYVASYGRGAGSPLSTCGAGHDKSGLLCYPSCKSGYTGDGPVCWQICPAGTTDTGVACLTPIGTYNKGCCCLFGNCCGCNPGYTDFGCTCTGGGTSQTKSSYGRTAGSPMGCASGLQQSGALCYPACHTGYTGNGPVCWDSVKPSAFPVSCNAIVYAKDQETCNTVNEAFATISVDVVEFIASCLEDPDPEPLISAIEHVPDLIFGVCPS